MIEAVRPAVTGDVPRLAELAREAITELTPTRGGVVFSAREARREPLESSFSADLDDTTGAVVAVGTLDDHVVGYGVGRVEELGDATRLGVIADLFVEPGAREVGIGELLVGHLLDWFRLAGCAGVDAHALPGNRATKNFFEGAGFSARLLVMHHRLEGE